MDRRTREEDGERGGGGAKEEEDIIMNYICLRLSQFYTLSETINS